MGKRRVGQYPRAFRQMAVDRLRKCDNVVVLSEELGVHRRLLYKWRKQLEPTEPGEQAPADTAGVYPWQGNQPAQAAPGREGPGG